MTAAEPSTEHARPVSLDPPQSWSARSWCPHCGAEAEAIRATERDAEVGARVQIDAHMARAHGGQA